MTGRGEWNVQGVGGTKDYRRLTSSATITPGPYYYTGTGYPVDGKRDANQYACFAAVKAYQSRLTAEGFKCLIDGLYGPATTKIMVEFQRAWAATGDPKASVWGGVGPETSERLLKPQLIKVHSMVVHDPKVTAKIVSGVVRAESNWDAGSVGYQDETDVGLAQINAGAHPQWTTDQRLDPAFSFTFIIDYLTQSLIALKGNLRDSIASYNLGVGGAQNWIKAGRPDVWVPSPGSKPREVKKYIDKILAG